MGSALDVQVPSHGVEGRRWGSDKSGEPRGHGETRPVDARVEVDLRYEAVYRLLFCDREGELVSWYVGQDVNARDRLRKHARTKVKKHATSHPQGILCVEYARLPEVSVLLPGREPVKLGVPLLGHDRNLVEQAAIMSSQEQYPEKGLNALPQDLQRLVKRE